MVGYAHHPFQSCDPCGFESIMGGAAKDHRYLCKHPITFADPGPSNFPAVHVPLLYSSQQHGFSMPVYQGTLPPSKVLLSLVISVKPVCLQPSSSPIFQLLHHFQSSNKATISVLYLYSETCTNPWSSALMYKRYLHTHLIFPFQLFTHNQLFNPNS